MKKILFVFLGICISYSSALLSIFLFSIGHIINNINLLQIFITFIISFFTAFFIYIKNYKCIIENYKTKKFIYFLASFLSIILLVNFHKFYTYYDYDSFNTLFKFSQIQNIILIFLGLLFYILLLLIKIKEITKIFISKLEPSDKKVFLIFSFIIILIISILYNYNFGFFVQYDKVYSMDSGFVLNSIYKNLAYYDVRHPLLNIPSSVIYFITKSFLYLFTNSDTALAILIQIINAELLLIIGFILKIITKNKMIFYLYMFSFPTMLFMIFLEKYQLCVFFIILYIFLLYIKKNGNLAIALSAGCMPSSSFIGICEILKKDKVKKKIINIIKIIITTLVLIIILGKINNLVNSYSDIIEMKSKYVNTNISFLGRVISFMNLITSLIIALPSSVVKDKFLWDNLTTNINYLSILILIISIIGFIKNRKDYFNKVFIAWLGFAFILFVFLKWSTNESPLFSLYFSWALIPLFIEGIDYITKRFKINRKITYIILFSIILIINISTLININHFLLKSF